jgi:hypothetical protein
LPVVYAALIEPGVDVNTLTVARVAKLVGRRDCTHKLRRTFGTEVAKREGLVAARELLGHSTDAVTERYVDESITRVNVQHFSLAAENDFLAVNASRRAIDQGRTPSLLDQMDRQEMQVRERRLFDRCMESKGYRPVDTESPPAGAPAPPAPAGAGQ